VLVQVSQSFELQDCGSETRQTSQVLQTRTRVLKPPMAGTIAVVSLAGPPCTCVGGRSSDSYCGVVVARRHGHHSCTGSQKTKSQIQLYCSMTQVWQDWRSTARVLLSTVPPCTSDHHGPMVVDDLGGQYEEGFDDVQKHLLDYFTYKAVKTVLAQLSEMNPVQYAWFYK
jgi:hypothetical protein